MNKTVKKAYKMSFANKIKAIIHVALGHPVVVNVALDAPLCFSKERSGKIQSHIFGCNIDFTGMAPYKEEQLAQ
jgi:hypothetical protein